MKLLIALHHTECVVPENILTPPTEGFSHLEFPVKVHTFLQKVWFKDPLPLRISDDPPWAGYEHLLGPNSVNSDKSTDQRRDCGYY